VYDSPGATSRATALHSALAGAVIGSKQMNGTPGGENTCAAGYRRSCDCQDASAFLLGGPGRQWLWEPSGKVPVGAVEHRRAWWSSRA
jgi:hypothetical protein